MLQIKENSTTDILTDIFPWSSEGVVDTKIIDYFQLQEIDENHFLTKPWPDKPLATGSDNKSRINPAQTLKKINNLDTIDEISQLTDNWDLEGASAFKEKAILTVSNLIQNPSLKYQPDIFPTFRDSIQIEYEKRNGDYLEFEIFENQITMLKIVNERETKSLFFNANKMITTINEFMHES